MNNISLLAGVKECLRSVLNIDNVPRNVELEPLPTFRARYWLKVNRTDIAQQHEQAVLSSRFCADFRIRWL